MVTSTPPPANPFGVIRPIKLEEEMRSSYLDYAMSVIVARALPDVRDGLKPVHRRILYAMDEQNIRPGTPYRKSARIVGEVLGKYHPHGDAPVYDALVRMAQPFSMRYPLVDGQGNFGSVDNDPPAAMRYTEARLARIAMEVLADIDQETVEFTANFDSSLREPTVLPARLPNLLVNGSSGIAVGMATNIPPHNLSEVCDGIVYLIEHEDASIDDLIKLVKGPDFPTGATIMGKAGIQEAFHTGHGRVVVRAKAEIEEIKNREQIVVTEIPYQINKAALIEKIAELVKDKRIDGISEVRDESDRDGMRIVIELRRDAMPEQVLNNLYKMTALQSSFFINMLALVDGAPRTLNLRQALHEYIVFRQEIVRKRSEFQLRKAQERAHILEGLLKAIENLDAVIETIRNSADAETARTNLMTQFTLTQIQAQAILDLQLRRLAALERQRIQEEYDELMKTIAYLTDLLTSPKKILGVVKDETVKLKEEFGDKRMTQISAEEAREFADEDLIPHVNVAISISNRGYAKRLPMEAYRIQRRGGQGKIGMITREQDVVEHLLIADTHAHLLFFTNKGRVLHLKTYRIPQEATRAARGTPLINLIPVAPDERVTAVVATSTFEFDRYLMLFTRNGRAQLTQIKEFAYVLERTKGINAMKLSNGDELVSVAMVAQDDQVIATTQQGRSLRFPVKDVTPHHRNSMGVRGMRVQKGDRIISMERAREGAFLMVLGTKGLGKLTKLESYTEHHRGTGGITTLKITPRTGPVAAARVVDNDDELMVISKGGIMLRTTLAQVRITGRTAQGVRIMEVGEGDTVASTATFGPQVEAEVAAVAAEAAPEEPVAEVKEPAKATKAKGKGKAAPAAKAANAAPKSKAATAPKAKVKVAAPGKKAKAAAKPKATAKKGPKGKGK